MGMTLSALSMQMKALETELGVALFDRSVRPPRLTPIGYSVVGEAIALLQREDSLLETCKPGADLVGHYKLGFVTTAAVRLLPRFLLSARKMAPMATFEVETGLSAVLQGKVLSGQIDAAVITDADGFQGQLSTRLLRRDPFVFAAHEDLMQEGLQGLLADQTFFHFMPQTGIGKLIAGAIADQARPVEAKTIVLDNLEAIMECVATGAGFTLLPLPDVDRYMTPQIRKLTAPQTLQRRLVLAMSRDGAAAPREDAIAALFSAE